MDTLLFLSAIVVMISLADADTADRTTLLTVPHHEILRRFFSLDAGGFNVSRLEATYNAFPFLYTRRSASFQSCAANFTTCEPSLMSNEVKQKWARYSQTCTSNYCHCLPSGHMASNGMCTYAPPRGDEMCRFVEFCLPSFDVCIRAFEDMLPPACDSFRKCANDPAVISADTALCVASRSTRFPQCDVHISCSMHPTLRAQATPQWWVFFLLSVVALIFIMFGLFRFVLVRRFRGLVEEARRRVGYANHADLARLHNALVEGAEDSEMDEFNAVLRVERNTAIGNCEKCKQQRATQLSVPCMCASCGDCFPNAETAEFCAVCSETDLCVVCMDSPSAAMCSPCGHYALCGPCSDRVAEGKAVCPLCRDEVTIMCKMPLPGGHNEPLNPSS